MALSLKLLGTFIFGVFLIIIPYMLFIFVFFFL